MKQTGRCVVNDTSDLYNQMKKGPVFLYLGQGYLSLATGQDPFLDEILRKYGKGAEGIRSYFDIFNGNAQNSKEDAFAWMQGRCERFSIPEWVNTISEYSWNGVYTSAIDTIWLKAFRKEWREIQPIFDEVYNPSNPRSKTKLHCTFLFGRIDRSFENENAPLSQREYRKRKLIAISFSRRLPELITPFGTFLIEGYQGDRDWFSLDDLLSSVVDELLPGQVHLFSADTSIINNAYAFSLIQEKKLIIHDQSLATFLLRGSESGMLQLGQTIEKKEHGRHIRIGDFDFVIPINVWNQVSRSARIIDDSVIVRPKPLSADAQYREFRKFLAESGVIPVWSGYAREFAFKRDFQSILKAAVDKMLKQKDLHDEPILLVGQTGTGKTIALGQLVFDIRKEEKYPVLFIEGKAKRPINTDIDAFCQWLRNEWSRIGRIGTPTIIIIWDLNDVTQYYELLRYLSGRGHRVVLIGSSYNQDFLDDNKKKFIKVDAPIQLSPNEIRGFIDFLNRFEPSLGEQLSQLIKTADKSFLVALYRLLPDTRAMIKTGVIKEYDQAEKNIDRIAQGITDDSNETLDLSGLILYHALVKRGIIPELKMLSPETTEMGGEEVSETKQLLGLVMVPGCLNLNVPFELLLRTLHKDEIRLYSDLLTKFDIFQWYYDEDGTYNIGPRNSLEATLWVRANIGSPKYEVEYVNKLLFNIKDTGEFVNNPEVNFAVDLVRNMGPNNIARSRRYFPFFKEISDTLGALRDKRNIKNPRIMLQETTLMREYVLDQSQLGTPLDESEKNLDKAEEIIREAIDVAGHDRKLKSILFCELASVLGTKFVDTITQPRDITRALRQFEDVREAAYRAWRLNPEGYFPIDILCWTTRELLGNERVDQRTRLEAEANILHAFEMAELENFDVVQETRLQRRRMEIGIITEKQELTEDAFNRLVALGSTAGYYLKAKYIIQGIPLDNLLTERHKQRCEEVVTYLQENFEFIKEDGRSLYLLLQLWWIIKTGKPIFYGEKQTVGFNHEDWSYCAQLLSVLSKLDEIYTNPRLLFLMALASFHLDDFNDAFDIFKQLERESDYRTGRRRVIRSYIASSDTGIAKKYSGEVRWVSDDVSEGGIYVPQLRRVITFFPREFNRLDIKKGESLEFYLAFNFLGPICQPT
jgi:hypothetical protein